MKNVNQLMELSFEDQTATEGGSIKERVHNALEKVFGGFHVVFGLCEH